MKGVGGGGLEHVSMVERLQEWDNLYNSVWGEGRVLRNFLLLSALIHRVVKHVSEGAESSPSQRVALPEDGGVAHFWGRRRSEQSAVSGNRTATFHRVASFLLSGQLAG
jgi:hypothetical protein